MRMPRLGKRKARKPTPSEGSHLVVGLRNPGPRYEGTRHNLGFMAVERLLERSGERLRRGPSRLRGLIAGDGRALYLAPGTFMNESGASVRAAAAYFKVAPEDVLVVHDDIDLALGRLKIQVSGGAGGHNGVRSVASSLGGPGFSRLKMGVGRPPSGRDPAEYVLDRFSKHELDEVESMIEDAADVIERWLEDRDRATEMAATRGRDR